MFFDISGFALPACSITWEQPSIMYDVCGKEYAVGNPTDGMILDLEDQFDTIDTDLWKFRSGHYRENVYCVGYNPENTYTDSEGLVLKAIKNNPEAGYEWSSPYMRTYDTDNFIASYEMLYGAVEAKIKFSDAHKFHTTLWMLRTRIDGVYYNGEIDIAECANGLIHFGVHCFGIQKNDGITEKAYIIAYYPQKADEHNVYTFVWTHEYIAVYCNNIYIARFPLSAAEIEGVNSLTHPYYVVLNTIPVSETETDEITNNIEYIKFFKLSQ